MFVWMETIKEDRWYNCEQVYLSSWYVKNKGIKKKKKKKHSEFVGIASATPIFSPGHTNAVGKKTAFHTLTVIPVALSP